MVCTNVGNSNIFVNVGCNGYGAKSSDEIGRRAANVLLSAFKLD